MKINQNVSLSLQNQMLQGFDFNMVQSVTALGGPALSDFIKEYAECHSGLELSFRNASSHDIDFSRIEEKLSLYDHLSFQIETGFLLEEKQEAYQIIGNLDANGFYDGKITPVLEKIWYLDPVGIGTRCAKEAMLIQLIDSGKKETLSYRILKKGYRDFLRKDNGALAKSFKVSKEKIIEAIKVIKTLTPFPARGFEHHIPQYAQAEMTLTFDKEWKLEFNKEFYPQCHMKAGLVGKKKVEAQRFIALLNMRKKRLEYVAAQVVKKQHRFLKGEGELKVVCRDKLLQALDISQSTLSRLLSEKFVQTPVGIYPLGFFFTMKSKVSSPAKKAKEILKELIDQENKKKPYSDEELKSELQKEGIALSRRSVAKYRKALLIPGAYNRARK